MKTPTHSSENKPLARWDVALIAFEAYVVAGFVVMLVAPVLGYYDPDNPAPGARGVMRGVAYGCLVSIGGLLVGALLAWRVGKRRTSAWIALICAVFGWILVGWLMPNFITPTK